MPEASIAIFSGYYASHGGGIELVSEKLANGLIEHGYRVLWCALDDESPSVGPVERRPIPGTDIAYRLTGTPMPLPAPAAVRQIWRAVKNAQVVLIAEANFVSNAIAFMVARLLGRPVLLVQHLGLPSTSSRLARWLSYVGDRFVARPMIRSADTTVFVSPVVQKYFAPLVSRSDDLVIGHGTDVQLFRPSRSTAERASDRQAFGLAPEAHVACFVGRCTVSKGVQVLAEIARKRADWTFMIAGSGPIDPAEWNLPNVKPLGHIDQNRLAMLYRASDLLVLPSPSESFSLVVREALACGTKVLCGDNILLTDPQLEQYVSSIPVDLANVDGTSSHFAEALDKQSPLLDGAAYVAHHCSWEAVIARYAEAVERLSDLRSKPQLAIA